MVPKPDRSSRVEEDTTARHMQEPSVAMRKDAEQRISWVEVDDFDNIGHGVGFWHEEVWSSSDTGRDAEALIAFIPDFSWMHGGKAVVQILQKQPTFVTMDSWLKIKQTTKDAIVTFLSGQDRVDGSFRYGPVIVRFNG